jgi:hypothetical protein
MQNNKQDISNLALLNAGDEDESMDADQFKTIVMGMKLTKRPVIFAAYYVLVSGHRVGEAADKYDVKQNHLSTVIGNIRANIPDLEAKAGGKYRTLVLNDDEYAMAKAFQSKRLKPLLDRNRERWEKYGLDQEFDTE